MAEASWESLEDPRRVWAKAQVLAAVPAPDTAAFCTEIEVQHVPVALVRPFDSSRGIPRPFTGLLLVGWGPVLLEGTLPPQRQHLLPNGRVVVFECTNDLEERLG